MITCTKAQRINLPVAIIFTVTVTQTIAICKKYHVWFGSDTCKYKCHCEDNDLCDTSTGQCLTGCADGWFGPSCQYVSSKFNTSTESADLSWLLDNNKTACNDGTVQSVTILLDSPQPLSWIRLVVKDSANSQFELSYTSTQGVVTSCPTDQTAIVDDISVDISCPSDVSVNQLTLSGSGVGGLCLIHISGGRNVALKQEDTSQSSRVFWGYMGHINWNPRHAVDGNNVDTGYDNKKICTQTKPHTSHQGWWLLRFSDPVVIYKYVIYNRNDCCQGRLNGFLLETWGTDGKLILPTYRDNHTEENIPVYTVVPETSIGTPVSSIRFTSNNDEKILTLCEVEVYGDLDLILWKGNITDRSGLLLLLPYMPV